MPFYLGIMTLPKSLVVVLAMLTSCLLSSCSVQKRTTAPGWHVEKASRVLRQAGPSNSLSLDVKSESPALQRMDRLPPRALSWTTSTFAADTSAVDAKVKRQVKRILRGEIRLRKRMLMYPRGAFRNEYERSAYELHVRAARKCAAQGQQLSEFAPEEFSQLEHLQDPSRKTMRKLKGRKVVEFLALAVSLAVFAFMMLLVIAFASNPWGGG